MSDFENDLRTAVKASVAAVTVPPFATRVAPPRSRRSRPFVWWTAAAAAGVALTFAATDAGRIAIANAVTHSVVFFHPGDEAAHEVGLDEAIRTVGFHAGLPRALPPGARLVSAHRIDSADMQSLLFQYAVHGKTFEIFEFAGRNGRPIHPGRHWERPPLGPLGPNRTGTFVLIGGEAGPIARIRSASLHSRNVHGVTFLLTAEAGALSDAQAAEILQATSAR